MPSTFSVVLLRLKSGAISTILTMSMTRRMPITKRIEFLSSVWCLTQIDMASSLRRLERGRGGGGDRLAVPDGHPEIVGHEQGADDVERAACGPDHVERMHRLDRLDERVLKKAK